MTDSRRIPVFPLGGLVLFPHTRQLLHIFEPRYRQMTKDALAGDRQIGLVLPRDSEASAESPPPLHAIGCLGHITASRELPDGRFLILLEGRTRFRVLSEEPTPKLYRIVLAEMLQEPSLSDLDPAEQAELANAREQLETSMLALTQRLDPGAVETLREQMRTLDPIQLTHALAFGMDCEAIEKQGLLEAAGPLLRCRQLTDLVDFRYAASRLPESPRTLN